MGSGPNKGQNPVEWEEIPHKDQSIRPTNCKSVPLASLQIPLTDPQTFLADPMTPLAGPQGPLAGLQTPWPALRLCDWPSDPFWLALRPPCLALRPFWAGPYTHLAGLQTP